MGNLGWSRTTGGTYYCQSCERMVDATPVAPVWRYFTTTTTSSVCFCEECAERKVAA